MWHVPVPLYMPVYEEKSTCQNGAQQPDNCNMVTWSVLNRNNAHVTKRVLKTTAPRNPRTRTEEPTHWMHSNFLSHGFGTRASLTWLRTYDFCHRLQYSGLFRLSYFEFSHMASKESMQNECLASETTPLTSPEGTTKGMHKCRHPSTANASPQHFKLRKY